MGGVRIRTFVYDTGEERKGSILTPIEALDRLPRTFMGLEGSLEFHIDGVAVLTNDSLPGGYIWSWWEQALPAVADLLSLRTTAWALHGKTVSVPIEVLPGTRRARVWARRANGTAHSPTAEARVPELAEAMLDEADRFFRWTEGKGWIDPKASLDRVAELRRAPAPWRR
jgi:hypothetical protein